MSDFGKGEGTGLDVRDSRITNPRHASELFTCSPDSHGGRLTGKCPVLGTVSFCLLGLLSMSYVMPTAAELQICAGVVRATRLAVRLVPPQFLH